MNCTLLPPPDPSYTFRPHLGTVQSLQYISFKGKDSFLSCTLPGNLILWDLRLKHQYWLFKQDGDLLAANFVSLKDKHYLVTLQKGGKLSLITVDDSQVVCQKTLPNGGFCGITFLGNNEPIGVLLADKDFGKINVFDFSVENITTRFSAKTPESKGICMCLKYFDDEQMKCVLGGFENGEILCWDVTNPNEETSKVKLFSEPVICLDYLPSTRHGVCGSPLNTLETFTFSKELVRKYSVPVKNNGISSVKIRFDGRIMASGGWDGRVRVFGCKKGKPLAILNFHSDVVTCLEFINDESANEYSNALICGSKDEKISIWKLY